jgi:hypothetical protein
MAYIHDTSDFEPNAVVSKDGSVFLAPANRIETNNCKPSHDGGTECTFKFGSWTYSGNEKKLSYPSDCLPFIVVANKTTVNRHFSSDFIYLHETVLANYSWSSLKS